MFALSKEDGVVTIVVDGQLVVGNRQELRGMVKGEIEQGSKDFVLDFSRCGYIDSSGLGVLMSLRKNIREEKGKLQLVDLSEVVRDTFEAIDGLCELFGIEETHTA